MKKVFVFLLFSFAQLCFASSETPSGYEWGNGGYFVSCGAGSIVGEGVFSVDRLEGQFLHSLPVADYLLTLKDETVIVNEILNRLEPVNPTRAKLYRKWLQEIFDSREFVENFFFMPIPDSGSTMIPEGCKQEQAAIFISSPNLSRVRFLFNKKLWDKASHIDRAFLLMHELIYREATSAENQHRSSVAARYFNAWLLSQLPSLNDLDIIDILRSLHFKSADYQGMPIVLNARFDINKPHLVRMSPIDRFPGTRKIKRAPLGPVFSIRIGDEVFHRVCNDSFTDFDFLGFVEFDEQGIIRKIFFDSDNSVGPIWDTPRFTETNCNFKGNNYFEFNQDGDVTLMEFRKFQSTK